MCGWRLMAIATDTARCFSTPDKRDWGWSIGKLSAHHSHPGTGYANTYSHPLSLFLSPSQTDTVFLSLQNTHFLTHTHFLCVKRQGRDFIASEVMRPRLPHSLQCSTDSPRALFHSFRTLRSISGLLFTPYIPILPHHFSSLSIFSSSHCPFFLNITLSFVALIWNKFWGDFEDVSNQNKV